MAFYQRRYSGTHILAAYNYRRNKARKARDAALKRFDKHNQAVEEVIIKLLFGFVLCLLLLDMLAIKIAGLAVS